jgi:hypothetical protein
VGIYDLRLGDAHLPSEKIAEAFELIGLNASAPPLVQGQQLLEIAATALHRIGDKIHVALRESQARPGPT